MILPHEVTTDINPIDSRVVTAGAISGATAEVTAGVLID